MNETSNRLGLPADLLSEAEDFKYANSGIYPDNMKVTNVFSKMLTQWRVGPGGLVGLDYGEPLTRVYKRVGVLPEEEDDIFDCLQIMEMAAMESTRTNQC